MKRLSLVIAVLVLVSPILVADTPTISKIKSGQAGYEAGCNVARSLGLNVCGEYDRLGRLKPEYDPKRVIPKEIKKAAKKVWGTVKKAWNNHCKREFEKAQKKNYYSGSKW
jgi:hypothetical protein